MPLFKKYMKKKKKIHFPITFKNIKGQKSMYTLLTYQKSSFH